MLEIKVYVKTDWENVCEENVRRRGQLGWGMTSVEFRDLKGSKSRVKLCRKTLKYSHKNGVIIAYYSCLHIQSFAV